ncbi:MAG: anti-sigma factor family protein [Pseudomonadota bacterium]|jgi:anti-sigma factor RsiW
MAWQAANDDRARAGALAISDDDLDAYVGGGLEAARRTQVEGFLACNPDIAARVMTELHRRGRAAPARPRGKPWRRLSAAVVACVASGAVGWNAARATVADSWLGDLMSGAPAYVEEALESRQATLVRSAMISQAETPTLDRAEVQRALKVRAPELPAGWRLIDAQVFPSDDGPGLNILLESPAGRRLSLFAVQADTWVSSRPVLTRRGGDAVAYWEDGASAFVLIGGASGGRLLDEARALAQAG